MFTYTDILKDAGAKTASGYGEVAAVAKTINLGAGLVRGNVVFDVSAMALQSNDELYQILLMGGNNASFTKEVALANIELGCREVIEETLDSKLGRYILPFENEKNGVVYPYVRIRFVISGTTPSINFVARLEKDLPIRGTVVTDRSFASTTTT